MERRRSHRLRTRFDTLYSAGEKEGAGVLTEISYNGARIEEASLVPEDGTRVAVYVFVLPVSPFELAGHVARSSDSSFAVHYDVFDPEIRRLVDDVAAIVEAAAAPGSTES